jgi:hypothetical protein
MKLEYYEITAALAAGNYGQAVDIVLAHFGKKDSHLSFEITTWARGPMLPFYSVRLYYYSGTELSWNPHSGFIIGSAYEYVRHSRNGYLGRVVVIA